MYGVAAELVSSGAVVSFRWDDRPGLFLRRKSGAALVFGSPD